MKSILEEAGKIVSGDRDEQYGDQGKAFQVYACLIAVKLGRERYKHKRDNLVDLCGYAEIYNNLKEAGNV